MCATLSPATRTHGKGERLQEGGSAAENAELGDHGLVLRFLEGRDEDSFRMLFRRHTPALFNLALRLLGGDRAAAEDAVQEAWIRAMERLAVFRFESALRTWLCGFVVNCCREARRGRGPAPERQEEDDGEAPAVTVEGIDLERAVTGLPEGYRQVLVLHDVMGFTHGEIARHLGVEEGTSKSQLFLARRALRRRLGLRERGSPWMSPTT